MVHTAAKGYGFFLEITQSGSRLTRVEHVALGIGNQTLVTVRRGGYAGHPLHDIEHRALDLQQTELLAIDAEGDVAFLHVIAVVQELLEPARGVEVVDDLLGYLHAGEDTLLLDDQLLAALGVSGDTTERGVVTVAYIFVKPDSDKLTQSFFFHMGYNLLVLITCYTLRTYVVPIGR